MFSFLRQKVQCENVNKHQKILQTLWREIKFFWDYMSDFYINKHPHLLDESGTHIRIVWTHFFYSENLYFNYHINLVFSQTIQSSQIL